MRMAWRLASARDDDGGIPGNDGAGFDVAVNKGAGAHDGATTDGDAGTDEGLRGDPDILLDNNGRALEGQAGVVDVVGGGAQDGVEADDDAVGDLDPEPVVEEDAVVEVDVAPDLQPPGRPYADGRLELR